MHEKFRSSRRQRGVAMLEVLVAMLIFAIGILALARLQIVSLQVSQSALQRSQATALVYELLDRMRANRKAAQQGAYSMEFASCASGSGGTTRAEKDKNEWLDQVKYRLANGCAQVEKSGQLVVISVRWGDQPNSATASPNAGETVVVRTEL